MLIKPFIIKDLFEPRLMGQVMSIARKMKEDGKLRKEMTNCFRYYENNIPFFKLLHHEFVTPIANKIFKEQLKPSYSYLSCYIPGKGVCPIHVDRPPCYRTIDLCLSQNQSWPLFVNSNKEYANLDARRLENEAELVQSIKAGAKVYTFNQGEALCYSGTDHPHWREKIQENNFCDLLFFHFVKKNYKGCLE